MPTSGILASSLVLVLAVVGLAVATDAFERTAGNSWGSADTSGSTLITVRVSCPKVAQRRRTSVALSACTSTRSAGAANLVSLPSPAVNGVIRLEGELK
jgi:hypothetical protein